MSEHAVFWTTQRRATLLKFAEEAMQLHEIKAAQLPFFLKQHLPQRLHDEFIASDMTYRRIFDQRTNGKPRARTITGMLVGVCESLNRKIEWKDKSKDYFRPLFNLLDEATQKSGPLYEKVVESDNYEKPLTEGSARKKLSNQNEVLIAIELAMSFLDISMGELKSIERSFFNENHGVKRHFITYRFTAIAGVVQKSFTVVKKGSPLFPVVTFANFLDFDGSTRVSRGMVLPFREQVAFVGSSDGGAALKAYAMKRSQNPRKYYSGLLLTTDPLGSHVAARFVMEETDKTNHDEISPFQIQVEHLEEENPKIVADIRNTINFRMEKKLYDINKEQIDQSRMVSIIDSAVHESDRYKMLDEYGKIFNPATSNNYTFNSALKDRD